MVNGYGGQPHFQQYFSYIVGSVLLVEQTGIPTENHRPAASHCRKFYNRKNYM